MKEIVLSLLANATVVIGWIVVFRQAIHLRRREDLRKTVDLVSKTVDEIYTLTTEYYSVNDGHITYLSANIKAKFVLLSHYLILLRGTNIVEGVSSILREFKLHSTGGYFETIDYRQQESLPNWRVSLAASAHELKFRVEKGYFDWSKSNSTLRATLLPAT